MEEKYTFSKSERLYHKKEIQELFSKGSSFYLFPFRVVHRPARSSAVHQVLITVSKRSFKKAVDRNRIKRQIREAYRLNKHLLAEVPPLQLGFIFTAKEKVAYTDIENGMKRSLLRLGRNQLSDHELSSEH